MMGKGGCLTAVGMLVASICFCGVCSGADPILFSGTGNYYDRVDLSGGLTWDQAKTDAENKSYQGFLGHLVTVTSQEEWDFVVNNLLANPIDDRYWLGGFQPPGSAEPDGNWQWVTGEEWSFTNWGAGEPNNMGGDEDALHLTISASNAWNDVNRNVTGWNGGYLLEYPVPEATEIEIDIKPSSDPNSINLCSKGVVPVAVLGSDTLDVEELDLGTLTFGGASPKEKGKSGKVGSFEDVNDDQFLDLILHFPTPDLDIEGDAEEAFLTGFLNDGTEINGNDTVRIVKSADMGDCNLDGAVDVGDLGILAYHYGHEHRSWTEGDFNGDAHVDVADLGILAASCRGDIAAAGVDLDVVPEPATLLLLGFAGLVILRRSSH